MAARENPAGVSPAPRATLLAQDLLELAESFYRYRVERWTLGEPGGAGRVRAFEAKISNSALSN